MTTYRDIEFSQIADDWDSAPLGREPEPLLLLMRNGLTVEQDKKQGEVRVTRIETISDGFIAEHRVRFASGLNAEHVEKYRIQKGDILFSHINSDPHLGKTAIAVRDYKDLLHGMNLLLLRANRQILLPEFLHFVCCYYRLKGVFVKICSRSVNQSSINQAKLRALEIPLPAISEQRNIAFVLDLVQQAIEQQERLFQLTTEVKNALLHQFFTQGPHGEPQKQTEIGPVPQSWEQRPLEETGEVVYGIQAAVAANLKPIGTKILTNKNITLDGKIVVDAINYFVLTTKRHHDTVLKKGDLLFNWRSGSKEHVGKTAYFDLDGEFTHSSFILRIRPRDGETGRYLFYYLNFLRVSGYFLKAQTFSVNAKFNKSAINRLPTYLPPEDEQREIVSALDAVGDKIEVVRARKQRLEELFRAMLHQLMAAQIRVRDLDLPELEAAAAE